MLEIRYFAWGLHFIGFWSTLKSKYTGDLNTIHSNNWTIWITDFHIRYSDCPLFKCPIPNIVIIGMCGVLTSMPSHPNPVNKWTYHAHFLLLGLWLTLCYDFFEYYLWNILQRSILCWGLSVHSKHEYFTLMCLIGSFVSIT